MGKSVKSLIEKMKVATLFLCLVGFATSQALTIQRDGEPMPSPPPIESEERDDDEDSRPPWETDEPDVDEVFSESDVRGEDDDEDGRPPWETDGETDEPQAPYDVRGEDEDEDVGPPPIRDPEDRYPGCHYADRYGNSSNTNRYSACPHWAAQGYCQGKYGTWMIANCAASCCC